MPPLVFVGHGTFPFRGLVALFFLRAKKTITFSGKAIFLFGHAWESTTSDAREQQPIGGLDLGVRACDRSAGVLVFQFGFLGAGGRALAKGTAAWAFF